MSSGLRFAILKAGELSGCDPRAYYIRGKYWLAEGLGIKVQSLNQWKKIPRNRVMMVHRLTGIPLEKLEPELFRTAKSNKATVRGSSSL